jgi:hypothetical protein
MNKLTIEHLAPYLPYRLKARDSFDDEAPIAEVVSLSSNITWGDITVLDISGIHHVENTKIKLILRPLSDLTDDKISEFNLDITDEIELRETRDHHKLATHLNYGLCQVLFKNHFDVFGLIDKGLAIDINQLNQ